MNLYLKIILTLLTLSIPTIFLVKHIKNIMLVSKEEQQKRLINGMLYILLVALIIDLIIGIILFIWSYQDL